MDSVGDITESLSRNLSRLMTLDGAAQLAVIVLGVIFAWFVNRLYKGYVRSRFGEEQKFSVHAAAVRGTLRLAFPISMLLVVKIGEQVLEHHGYSAGILKILGPLLLALATVRVVVFVLRRSLTSNTQLRASEGVISTIVWLVVAMHLLGWLPIVAEMLDAVGITVGSTRVSLLSVSELILMVAAFMLAAGWLSTTLERRLKASSHVSKSVRVGIVKFVRLFLYTLAGMLALNAAGIDLTTLAVFSGALGVGIGFGLKSIVSNFISGFILLFDRSIRPGDVIHIGDRFGWVKSLRARYVVIRDRDGVEVLIPNENLITSEVTNWSYSDRRVRLKLPVQISYSDEPEEAMGLLLQAAEGHGRLLREPPPQARLIGFGDNGIDLELRVWIRDPESGVGNIRSDINLSIWRLFKQHCVTIPFPQRDVYLHGETAAPQPQ